MTMRFISLVIFALIALLPVAQAQDTQALIEKIDRLERDIRTMERLVYRGKVEKPTSTGSGSGDITTGGGTLVDAEVRMSEMENQMRQLTGTVEGVDNRIAVLERRFDKLVRDLDLRLREIEQRLSPADPAMDKAQPAASAAKPEPKLNQNAAVQAPKPLTPKPKPATSEATTAVAVQLPAGTPEDQYNFAMNLLRTHKYDEAEGAFTAFLNENGDDRLAGHAQYWLGETYYVRNNLDAAARTYLTGYQKFPDGAKAPDMLLKLAVTLVKLGENSEACVILEELSGRFPDATSAIRNRARRERKKAGCA